MHCCTDRELESAIRENFKSINYYASDAKTNYHHHYQQQQQQQQPGLPQNPLIVAIAGSHKENGCLRVNVVINRTAIPISSATIASTTLSTTLTTATCLQLLTISPQIVHVPLLNIINFGNIGAITLTPVQIPFDCTATTTTTTSTTMFLPLHQQIHCQLENSTKPTIHETTMHQCGHRRRSVTVNDVTINKSVDTRMVNKCVSQTVDQHKAIKLKTTTTTTSSDYNMERPNNVTNLIEHMRQHTHIQYTTDDPDDEDDINNDNQKTSSSAHGIRNVAKRCDVARTKRKRHHHSTLPNDNNLTIVHTLYIDYRKMFCTFLLPLLIFLCNFGPSLQSGE